MARSIGQPGLGKASAGTPLMVLRDGHRLNAVAGVQLKGDTKKNGIESKSKSRLSSDAFGKRFGTSSSLLGVDLDELGLTAHSDSLSQNGTRRARAEESQATYPMGVSL
jgi:hypothetical protein